MKFFHLKRSRSRVHRTQRYPLYGALAVLLVAAIMLTVVWVGKNRAEQSNALARNNLVISIQTNLNAAIGAYEKTSLPTADLQGDIIPTMRNNLYAARMVNRVLEDTFKESVVSEQTLDQIEASIGQVEHMLTLGQSPNAALTALGTSLAQMEQELRERFADTGMLLSRTALK